jgi:phage recombination protein Bet
MNAPAKTTALVAKTQSTAVSAMTEDELINILRNSLYPGAQTDSIKMVLGYCQASGIDPMQKPVHIVPIWDTKLGAMRDVVMPGIGLYRTQMSRTGECAGVTEPEFGTDKTETLGGVEITYPTSCKVIVKRILPSGQIAEYAATERWKENYAMKGGKEKSAAPNAMWMKRPYAQLAKCAEAQALRKAFPELGAAPTAERRVSVSDLRRAL